MHTNDSTAIIVVDLIDDPHQPDTIDIENNEAFADERHEIVGALDPPAGVFAADYAGFLADLAAEVLERAGLEDAAEGLVMEHLTCEEIVNLAMGKDLRADHPFLLAIRGQAA